MESKTESYHLPIRPILKDSYSNMILKLKNTDDSKFLFQAFCGLGKSRPMYNLIFDYVKPLIVFVFPFINLLTQFNTDYIEQSSRPLVDIEQSSRPRVDKNFSFLSICSDTENQSSTDRTTIKRVLKSKKRKVILVTYQSLQTLYDCLIELEIKIDLCIFDEAHHSISSKCKNLIYTEPQYLKAIFFTATPREKNGIDMLTDCGERIANATYIDGLNSDALNEFEIIGNIMNNNQNTKIIQIYEIISRNILSTENNRVLTFHSYANSTKIIYDSEDESSETKSDTSSNSESYFKTNVEDFVNEELFIEVFNRIVNNEFPHLENKYRKITFKSIIAGTDISYRTQILNELDKTNDDEIYIISSCKTIGEGIDTKNANHIVFVDPKSSIVDIIQNIGRAVRKTDRTRRPSTISIPCSIDFERYRDKNTEEERDQVIREGIYKFGDFSAVMNVLTAIQQEDEEYYKMCLEYPKKHFKSEIERNLKAQDKTIVNKENIQTIVGVEREEKETDEQYLERVAEENQVRIELHTNDMNDNGENNIVNFGDEEQPIVHRIYRDGEEGSNYYEIEGGKQEEKSKPCKRRNISLKIKHSDDFKLLWNIENENDIIDKQISKCVLNCNMSGSYLDEMWNLKYEQLENFFLEYGRKPTKSSKNQIEKQIANWFDNQKSDYSSIENERKVRMKNLDRVRKWEELMTKYPDLFKTWDDDFDLNYEKLENFLSKNNKKPNRESKNEEESSLGKWFDGQKRDYSAIECERGNGMKNSERAIKWEELMSKYPEYFLTQDEIWYIKCKELENFWLKNNRKPNHRSCEVEEKQIGRWFVESKSMYNQDILARRLRMKNPEIAKKFEELMIKYPDLFKNYGKYNSGLEIEQKIEEIDYDNLEKYNKSKLHSICLKLKLKFKQRDKVSDLINLIKNRNKNEETTIENELEKDTIKQLKSKCSNLGINFPARITKKILIDLIKNNETKEESSSCEQITRNNQDVKKSITFNEQERKEEKPPNKCENEGCTSRIGLKEINGKKSCFKCRNNECKQERKEQTKVQTKPVPKSAMKKIKTETKHSDNETKTNTREKSEYEKISLSMSVQNSRTTNQRFISNNTEWEKYHLYRDFSFQGYPQEEIPVNKIIKYLNERPVDEIIENLRVNVLKILDLGCGKNLIKENFKRNSKFNIIGYDHVSYNGSISVDISNLPDEDNSVDFCIFSQSLMGSNWEEYLREGKRVLKYGIGEMIISESIDRIDSIKEKLNEIGGMTIIREDKVQNDNMIGRWFYIYAIRR